MAQIASSLSVTVYVEDINDHSPIFSGDPYSVAIDELTPVGITIFRGIRATDRDKPNTPNSDVQYAITSGNEKGKFTLGSSYVPFLILKKPLDYDTGDRKFRLIVTATDRGNPPLSSNAVVEVTVLDSDDLAPKFTKGIYRTKIPESFPISGRKVHQLIKFNPPIFAFDQDVSIDAPIRYDILAGNERHLFYLDHVNGSLFLEKEIDLESEKSLPGNTFVLQIQASQIDNPLRYGVARVEIEIIDLNDNLPEFERDYYNISIVENLPNGFSVMQITATDQDQGDNAEFSYELEDRSKAFSLNSKTGWLTVSNQTLLDREKRSSVRLRVLAKEKLINLLTNKIGVASVIVDVSLLDANDNNPTFIPSNIYEFVVDRDLNVGESVGRVHANDPDLEGNGLVTYSLQQTGNLKIPFRIDGNGRIILTQKLSNQKQYVVIVEASDNPNNPSEKRTSVAVVTIDVQFAAHPEDSPDFIGAPYEFWVGSDVGIGTSVGQIRVSDSHDKSGVSFDLLHSYEDGVPFAIEEHTGAISVIEKLSNYPRTMYNFEGVATYKEDESIITNVTIHVVDSELERTVLTKHTGSSPIEFHVLENRPGVFIGKIFQQNITSSSLQFVIANQKDVTDNIIVSSDGSLYAKRSLDREERDTYHLTVVAEYNKGAISGTAIYQVTVIVDDENDNAPEFGHAHYEGLIKENSPPGTEVDLSYLIRVTDSDIGENGQFSLTILGEGSEKFKIGKFSGRLTFSGTNFLDREEKEIYELQILAKDKGGLYSEAKLRITILDENDNPPVFTELSVTPNQGIKVLMFDSTLQKLTALEEQTGVSVTSYYFSNTSNKEYNEKVIPVLLVPEDIPVGSIMFKMLATDKDVGLNSDVTYSIISETYIPSDNYVYTSLDVRQYFTIIPTTGEVTVARNLPAQSEFRLNIAATDIGELRDNVTVQILINDVNNHPPVFLQSWYNFDIEEGLYSGKVLGQIEASDADFGKNANISYKIETDEAVYFPFTIDRFTGLLTVQGVLDREVQDKYSFVVVAEDNPEKGAKLSSKVNVDVNVLDINDNSPTFYGHDLELKVKDKIRGSEKLLPVYHAYAAEDNPVGTPVVKVFANDSDFSGNGNGLILFRIPYESGKQNFFSIDSKEGIITIMSKLDYEKQKQHNVTVIASDLGSPSLSSTALVMVNVVDVPENVTTIVEPLFVHKYYEVEIEENVPVPLQVLTINVTDHYRQKKLRFSLVDNGDEEIRKMYKVESRNGTLYIIRSPDRERRDLYNLGVKVDEYRVGRDMTVMVYPITDDKLGNLNNEVKIVIRITDVNDNPPAFATTGGPIIAAIPATASYGHPVLKLQATDQDLGINGEIRYQILSKPEEKFKRFAIDPVSGQIKTLASFESDSGKVFGFDVKAMDRRGADDGKSSIANVFVYILDEQQQLVMVLNKKPMEIEKDMESITRALYNITGYDVRVRKLEPHIEKKYVDNSVTDMYLYAVDPSLNVVVDMEKLKRVIHERQHDIEEHLGNNSILALTSSTSVQERAKQSTLLSRSEIIVVILACLIFLGAFITALCLLCPRKPSKREIANSYFHAPPSSYNMAMSGLSKSSLFPTSFEEGLQYTGREDRPDHFLPVPFPGKVGTACTRYTGRNKPHYRDRSKSTGGLETSVTSLHSSCHDSGIVDAGVHCACSHSTSRCSEDSSSNYEDSLNSTPRIRHQMKQHQVPPFNRKHRHKRFRNRSLSDGMMSPTSMTTFHSPLCNRTLNPVYLPGHNSSFRRSTDHLVMSSPVGP
ncbi:cadherin-89D [Agrilus planipennis]|uniref:Cadherin-89D n=1 Tax=Agrilus planipennis TaxID=224129 RepID=A0A1W4WRI2_AGRPL|nr:cadherin-89D [Agrilus planipennis]